MTKEERSRIRTYYEGTEYVSENILNNTPNLFSDIREIYNPIKNIVQGLTNSSIKDLEISSASDNVNLFVNEIWNANNMKSFKNKICKEVYIDGETYIEVIMLPDKKTINYILYKVDDIETLEEENGIINRFKISGTKSIYDEKGEKKDVSVSREYIRFISGKEYRVKKIEQDETGIIETPFSLNYIPVVKFEFNSNIYSALNIVDKINETEAYIRSIFSIHGDPDLHASNIPPYAGTTDKGKGEAQVLLEANYKKKKIIFTQDGSDQLQGKYKYIELTNPMIVEMQNDISRNESRLYTLFPEMLLVDTSTQNVSSETFSMKNNGLRTKISGFRASVLKGIMQLDNTALELLSKVERTTIEDYNFLDPFEEEERQKRINNINLALDIITKAKSIDTEQALSKIIDSISKDTLKELSELYD